MATGLAHRIRISEASILRTRKLERNGTLTQRTQAIGIILIVTVGSVSHRRQRNHGEDKSGCAKGNLKSTRGKNYSSEKCTSNSAASTAAASQRNKNSSSAEEFFAADATDAGEACRVISLSVNQSISQTVGQSSNASDAALSD